MTDAVLAELFQALHVAVIEHLPNHMFHLLAPAPTWLEEAFAAAPPGQQQSLAGALPFLEDFLRQAAGAWEAGPHASIVSGPFSATVNEEELLLRATAITVSSRQLLVVERLVGAADTRPILQKARRHLLEQEQLTKQVARLHAPVATLGTLVHELRSTTMSPGQTTIVDGLETATDHLRSALDAMPAPPGPVKP